MADKKIVVLFTPGVDSFLTKHKLESENISNINYHYFNLSTKYSDIEMNFLARYYNDVKVDNRLNMSVLEHEDAHVPNRNMLLATLAQGIYNADIVYLNGVKDDRVSDNTFEFRQQLSNVLSISADKQVEVRSCFDDIEKSQAVKSWALTQTHCDRLRILSNTFSCFNDNKSFYNSMFKIYFKDNDQFIHDSSTSYSGCLSCGACYRKLCTLTAANIYMKFKDLSIHEKYIKDIENIKKNLPNRAKTIIDYNKFLEWNNKQNG